jgi:hypothetical protein
MGCAHSSNVTNKKHTDSRIGNFLESDQLENGDGGGTKILKRILVELSQDRAQRRSFTLFVEPRVPMPEGYLEE